MARGRPAHRRAAGAGRHRPLHQRGIRIRDAKELRVKESDRIALVVKNLAPWELKWPNSKTA